MCYLFFFGNGYYYCKLGIDCFVGKELVLIGVYLVIGGYCNGFVGCGFYFVYFVLVIVVLLLFSGCDR